MKMNIWRLMQITWLALAMLTVYNSMRVLGSGSADYCSGLSCVSASDCGTECICNGLDNLCYAVPQPNI